MGQSPVTGLHLICRQDARRRQWVDRPSRRRRNRRHRFSSWVKLEATPGPWSSRLHVRLPTRPRTLPAYPANPARGITRRSRRLTFSRARLRVIRRQTCAPPAGVDHEPERCGAREHGEAGYPLTALDGIGRQWTRGGDALPSPNRRATRTKASARLAGDRRAVVTIDHDHGRRVARPAPEGWMRRFLYLVFVSALMPVAAIAPPTFARGEPSVSSDGAWRLDSVYPLPRGRCPSRRCCVTSNAATT